MSLLKVIPDGYKQTEIGVIPEGWDVSPLNEVCGFGGGTTPPRAQHDRYFVNGSNNWVKTTDLNNSLIDVSEEQITDLALLETGLKKHPVGSVLVAMYGGFNQIGRTGYITKPSAINQALVAVKPKPKKLNSYYLLSELNFNVAYWKGVASSSRKDPNITSNDVKNYVIALPPIEEQTAIANALSDVDALLAELEKLIVKKQAIKTATIQQLLTGKTRLPQFATYTDGDKKEQTKGTQPSELGEIPEDWGVLSIGEFSIKVGSGKTPKGGSSVYVDSGRPFVRSQNIGWGQLRLSDLSYITEEIHQTFSGSEIKTDDVLLNITGASIGRCALANQQIEKGNVNQHVCIIRLNSKKVKPYILQALVNSELGQNQIDSYQAGGNREGLNFSQVKNLKFPFSSIPKEQIAIATILTDMDEEIQALQQRLSKTRQIKQGMMQELLTGKTRLIQGEAHD
ncbi:restriction endonuclease subunit S [Vibrio splendidus]